MYLLEVFLIVKSIQKRTYIRKYIIHDNPLTYNYIFSFKRL